MREGSRRLAQEARLPLVGPAAAKKFEAEKQNLL